VRGQLAGKRAFITGGGGGIGRASGLAFAREGAAVAVADVVADAADETVRQVIAHGGTAVSIVADVSDEEQVQRAVAARSSCPPADGEPSGPRSRTARSSLFSVTLSTCQYA
jgi:NAD(P)-dependent dehydrogenase (short-subunit alcohol dehydrogenase family)